MIYSVNSVSANPELRTSDPASPGPTRIAWVDHAKGVCVTLVVMMHSTLGVGEAMGAEGFLHTFVAFAKPFRMPDFFMIAGLFLCRTINRDWRTFIDRKVAHFAYFYLLWFAIQWIFKGRLLEGPSASAAIDRLALGLVEPFGTLWFIYLLPILFVVTKLLRHAPATAVLFAAALLETARIRTGWTIPDEFAARYVYFLFGYIFAPRIFALAEWASSNPAKATVSLFVWACCNSALVFSPAPLPDYRYLADLPVVSLVAGIAGAGAVVVFATLLSLVAWNSWLEYCGRNSIVIYLSFFLPMAVTRTAITTFHLVSDVGTASLLVTLAGVTIPIVLHRHVRNGRLRFLFERPERFSLSSLKAISTTL